MLRCVAHADLRNCLIPPWQATSSCCGSLCRPQSSCKTREFQLRSERASAAARSQSCPSDVRLTIPHSLRFARAPSHISYILRDLEFHYPVFLTTFHLVYATIGVRLLAKTTHLLDGLKDAQMTWDRYMRNIVPIGALFSASLVFSNLAYITLSVSFIQM